MGAYLEESWVDSLAEVQQMPIYVADDKVQVLPHELLRPDHAATRERKGGMRFSLMGMKRRHVTAP